MRSKNEGSLEVFGTIKSAIGFTRFRLRGLINAANEWSLVTMAYNCRRIAECRRPERAILAVLAFNLSAATPIRQAASGENLTLGALGGRLR